MAHSLIHTIQRMTYPDGEVVSYGYNYGGMLKSVTGEKNGIQYPYINDISYNEFELKEIVDYGNGAQTIYKYDILQRLSHLESWSASGTMQSIDYSYDAVGNIDKIVNYAGMTSNGLGGLYENSYSYDNQYRLDYAIGYWDGAEMLNYETKLSYYDNGRIKSKTMEADLFAPSDNGMSHLSYDYNYHYHNLAQPNTLTDIDNSYHHHFEWDVKGNMVFHHNEHAGFDRRFCWDEQNRLQGVVDDMHQTFYQYDANGERTYKLTTSEQAQMVNGRWYYYTIMDNATLYASPYLVATRKGYTKHYYAESERIASKIGMGGLTDICQCLCPDMILPSGNQGGDPMNPLPDCEGTKECFYDKLALNHDHFDRVMRECLGSDLNIEPNTLNEALYNLRENMEEYEPDCYWYHPDHLGSSSWITYTDGTAVQHLHYLPFGEDFVNQRTSDFSARHTFSAKEKDTETGLSYFGARYYSSDLSIWLSVDPMSDKYPSLSPYVYCANNPIKLVDPNGEEIDPESLPLWNKMKSLIDFEKKLARAYMNLEKKTGGLLFAGATKKYFCLDKTQKSMEMMEESSQMYKLAECSGDVSSVSFNNKNNSLTVNFSNVAGFIHEITHCKQFEQGDIGFHRKRGTAFVDVYDELEAYQNQAFYDPRSLPHNVYEPLSVDWLRNIYDGKEFPYRSNGLISIGKNSTANDLNRAFPGTYFKFKGTVSSKYRRSLYFKK